MATKTFTASDGKVFDNRAEYKKYEFQLSYTFTDKEGVHDLIKLPGAVDGQPFDLANLKCCTAVVMDATDQVQIDEIEGCKVFLGATGESLFVRNCKDCTFYVACKQLRTRDCTNCTFYLYCISEPIIEMSTGIKFGCFNGGYPEQAAHMGKAGLDPRVNKWSMVFDFNDEAKTGKNWRVLDAAEYAEAWFPQGAACERAVPLLEGHVAAAQAYAIVPPEVGSGMSFSFTTTQEAAETAVAQAATVAPPAPPAPPAPAPAPAVLTPTEAPPATPPAAAAAPAVAEPEAAAAAEGAIVVGTKVEARFNKGTTFYLAIVSNVSADGTKFDLNYLDGNKEANVSAEFVQLPKKRMVGWNADKAKAAAAARKESGVPPPSALGSDPEAGLKLRALIEAEDAAAAAAAAAALGAPAAVETSAPAAEAPAVEPPAANDPAAAVEVVAAPAAKP
jgi:hypothetical protein